MLKNNNFVNPQLNGGNCNTPLEDTKFNNSKDNLEFKDTPKVKKLFDYVSGTFTFNDLDLLHKLFKILGYDNHEIFFNQTYRQGYQNFYELGEIFEYYLKDYSMHFNKDIIEINLEIDFKADIKSASYSGRDDETNEVILYPYYSHDVSGTVEFTIEKKINELLYNNTDYNVIDIKGNSFELSCKNLNEEDYED